MVEGNTLTTLNLEAPRPGFTYIGGNAPGKSPLDTKKATGKSLLM